MIPQADTKWFLSQFVWTGFFFLVQYLLSKFLVFEKPRKHKMSKQLSIELALEQIQTLKDDIAILKNQKIELEILEQREREVILKEVVEEQKQLYLEALAKLREEFAKVRTEKKQLLSQYSSLDPQLSTECIDIARRLAEKVVTN